MGYIRHNALIVTGDSYTEANEKLNVAHERAIEFFGELVSNIVKSEINGYQSFFIAPDGSKEGWDMSNDYNEKRKDFANYLDSLGYGDGSNCISFVDVGYDEYREVAIDRTNK